MTSLSRLQALTNTSSLTILIFYRGEWCPFCTTWARGLSSIRTLPRRLAELDAQVVFISSQREAKEAETWEHFRFTRERGLGSRVHFINDPGNLIATDVNNRWGKVVCVDAVPEGWGMQFKNGMVQPAVLCIREGEIVWKYCYDSDVGGVIGEDDRSPACTVLREVERACAELSCS